MVFKHNNGRMSCFLVIFIRHEREQYSLSLYPIRLYNASCVSRKLSFCRIHSTRCNIRIPMYVGRYLKYVWKRTLKTIHKCKVTIRYIKCIPPTKYGGTEGTVSLSKEKNLVQSRNHKNNLYSTPFSRDKRYTILSSKSQNKLL